MKKNIVFDKEKSLVKMPNSGPNYHSRVDTDFVHPLRESIEYALTLFDGMKDIDIAVKITESVISYQDTNEHSPCRGLWPYYAEEPLEKMSPPDYNWADFIGKQLLVIYMDYGKYLKDSVKEKIKQSVYAACECIIRRNERVSYTNIAMMDSFVCGAAGETFGCGRFLEYGSKKLRRLLEFTRSDGNISEYNSPVYTLVALGDAHWLCHYIHDEKMKKDAETFYKYLWKSLAEHYHVKTGELSGPQSRNYSVFLTEEQRHILLSAARLEDFAENVHMRDRIYVPDEYLNYFRQPRESYEIIRISNGFCYPCFANSKAEISYITNDFCMGSFHHDEMWNQSRPFLGFFGDGDKFAFVIQVLHDGYDFSDAEIHTAQYYGSALSVVNFASDRGDTHICLDFIKDKKIRAKDMRVRFKICGNVERLETEICSDTLYVRYGNAELKFTYVSAAFDGAKTKTELTKTESELYFDCILYSGEDKDIIFDFDLHKYCIFTVDINGGDECSAVYTTEKDRVNAKYRNMSVSTQANSVPFTMLNTGDTITIDQKNVEELAKNVLEI